MIWERFLSGGSDPSYLETLLNDCFQTFALPVDDSGFRQRASDYLASMHASKLIDVDERLRSYYGSPYRRWPEDAVPRTTRAKISPELRQPLLFLVAGHTDGRIRQKVLWLLPQFPGRLTLAAALIRCADWVPQVQFAAQDAVVRLLELCSDDDILEVWPLVIRLRSRTRVPGEWLHEHVENWVLKEAKWPLLLRMLGSENSTVRLWAYDAALNAETPPPIDVLDAAIRDPNPTIALHALRHAQAHCSASRALDLARQGLSAAHPVTRRESLHAMAKSTEPLSYDLLCQALCDRSAGVRSLSAFLLRERFAEDAAERWRDVLDHDGDSPTLGALISLADVAHEQDLVAMRRWLAHPRSVARMHCLRGILKANGEISDQELVQLITSGGTRVLSLLTISVRRGSIRFGLDRATYVIQSLPAKPEARESLREFFAALGHWDRLSLILRLQPNSDDQRSLWHDFVTDWVKVSNAYAPLGPTRRSELLALLKSRKTEFNPEHFKAVEGAVGHH
ncbi:HEAT repeat domain-containing protein [Dyella kyungheensis]|uniref:HEAT repeat domain-containing protein n=1 Tax=Dyella kyungheensis TaxID=1242174 RepID=A0ABS2JME1_9GAMM|nr:HEAT repeat domain-containing protein [Dyella kyungheensis]MBM7120209.1 HEAT repeat domain-containing protein [Dyella kyungheensis]